MPGGRDFRLLLWGRTCQMTGGAMTSLALMLITVDVTGSASWGAAVGAGNTLGILLTSLPAGVVADRIDRRALMVNTSLALVMVLGALLVLARAGALDGVVLVVASTLIGMLCTFFGPAEQASLVDLVEPHEMGAAAALNQARGSVAGLIAPSLAGVLYGVGRSLPLVGDALLNLASVALLLGIRRPLRAPATPGSVHPVADLRDGLRFIVGDRRLRTLLVLNAVAAFGFGGLLSLVTLRFAARGSAGRVIGMMQTGCGVAGLVGAMVTPRLLRRHRAGRLFLAGVLVNCGCALAMLRWRGPVAVTVLLALACVSLPPGMAGIQAYQLRITPAPLQGRVAGALGFLTLALGPAGTVLAGRLATGVAWPVAMSPFLGAVVLIGLLALAEPELRTLGRIGDEGATPE